MGAHPRERRDAREAPIALEGGAGRTDYPPRELDFEQAGLLYGVDRAIQVRQIGILRADVEYGTQVAAALGVPIADVQREVARGASR